MKKVNTLIVLLTLSFMFNSCQRDDDSIEKEEPKSGFFIPYKGRPSNMLDYSEIVSMLRDYDRSRRDVLQKSLGFEDTRMNFYKLELLENYIAYIKQISKEKEIELTGFNIISASYAPIVVGDPIDDERGESDRDSDPRLVSREGHQTLIFMPTTNIDGRTVTFDPLQSEKGKPVTFREILAGYEYDWYYDGFILKNDRRSSFDLDRKKKKNKGYFLRPKEQSSGSNRMNVVPPLKG